MPLSYKGQIWTATRGRNVNAGPSADGGGIRQVSEIGLILQPDSGDAVFCPLPLTAIPTDYQLRNLTSEEFAVYYELAVRADVSRA